MMYIYLCMCSVLLFRGKPRFLTPESTELNPAGGEEASDEIHRHTSTLSLTDTQRSVSPGTQLPCFFNTHTHTHTHTHKGSTIR